MTDKPARAGNLNVRLSSSERELLNRAAQAEGRTVTGFLRFHGLEAAERHRRAATMHHLDGNEQRGDLQGRGKQPCSVPGCLFKSIAGMVHGHGLCPYHYAADMWGKEWADRCYPKFSAAEP